LPINAWFTLDELNNHGYKQEVEDTPWQPKEGEDYYIPDINAGVAGSNRTEFIKRDKYDQHRLAAGLCFKTPEEATAAAQRMLDVLKPKEL